MSVFDIKSNILSFPTSDITVIYPYALFPTWRTDGHKRRIVTELVLTSLLVLNLLLAALKLFIPPSSA